MIRNNQPKNLHVNTLLILAIIIGWITITLSCRVASIIYPSTPTATITPTNTFTLTATLTPLPTVTETPSPKLQPTEIIPSGTPMANWHNLPIISGAIAADEEGNRWYHYTIKINQEDVRDFYIDQLPNYGWDVDWISPNDKGGFIIYRQGVFDFIYIFEEDDLTHVNIFLSTGSPSLDQ